MQITLANVGDIIRMDQGARYIQIEEVTDQYVQYLRESGHRYATFEHEVEGIIVRDQKRIADFKRNSDLGAALAYAESSALYSLMRADTSHEQRQDAYGVLSSVKSMKDHLSAQLARHRDLETGKERPRKSLESLIGKANSEIQEQRKPSVGKTGPNKGR